MTISKTNFATPTPVAANRAQRNVARVGIGVKNGAISANELDQIKNHAKDVLALRKQFKSDGTITAEERAQLQQAIQQGVSLIRTFVKIDDAPAPAQPIDIPAEETPTGNPVNVLA